MASRTTFVHPPYGNNNSNNTRCSVECVRLVRTYCRCSVYASQTDDGRSADAASSANSAPYGVRVAKMANVDVDVVALI